MSEPGRPRRSGPPVVVVGGGVAGLAAAWTLQRRGVPCKLLDRAAVVGGVMGTAEVGGHRFERGPTTVLSSGRHVARLIDEVGLRERVVESREEAHRRLVWRHGRLHELPSGPGGLVRSGLLSLRGKLRLLAEPLVPAPREPRDETLAELVTRRVGREVVDALVDPFVTGVFAGEVDALGADAFPTLRDLERDHGGLLRGMIARRRAGEERSERGMSSLLTFPEGLGELPRAIGEALGTRVRHRHEVVGIERVDEGEVAWRVHAMAGDRRVAYDAAGVILAVPSWVAAQLLEPLDPEAADSLAPIPHPHVATVGLGYRRDAVAHPLDAFGLLCAGDSPVPPEEPILGALFNSSIFPGRAPDGHVTLTVLVGGSRDPDAGEASDGALVDRARRALEILVGARGEPSAVRVTRWQRAIPQYRPGHAARIARVRERVGRLGRLELAGNYLDGPGVDPTIGTGFAAADRLAPDDGRDQSPSAARVSNTFR